jgi:hypothetical protein
VKRRILDLSTRRLGDYSTRPRAKTFSANGRAARRAEIRALEAFVFTNGWPVTLGYGNDGAKGSERSLEGRERHRGGIVMTNIRRWSAACAALATVMLTAACADAGTGYGRIVAAGSSSGTYAPPTPPTPSTSQPPPPPAEVPTERHSGGKGTSRFTTSWPAHEFAFLTFDCPKCSSNIFVDSDGGDHGLINAIGAYHGTVWFNVSPGKSTTAITVTANAAWTATIADYRSLPVAELGKETSGKGDAVLRIPAGTTKAALTSKGAGNFGVWVTAEPSFDLVVNEIGNYQNTLPMKGPAYVKIDDWDGKWTITPS